MERRRVVALMITVFVLCAAALGLGSNPVTAEHDEGASDAIPVATQTAEYGVFFPAIVGPVATGSATPVPTPGSDMAAEILIPSGPFQMGCDSSNTAEQCDSDEQPLHTVTLDAYYIDKFEVTNVRYRACVTAGGCTVPVNGNSWSHPSYYGNPTYADYPVLYLNWDQSTAFCTWAGKRLPTEAEWEKAARGSSDTRKYPWGNTAPDCTKLNFYLSSTGWCVGDTSHVGAYADGASPYGVMDMAGNVWEWVNDWYDSGYYSASPTSDPSGPATGEYHVSRGGSWYDGDNDSRIANRGDSNAASAVNIGFRCARTP